MRILLAEDEKELSNALVAVLKHNNYSVDAVFDGAEALEYLRAVSYDGVILDVMMPKVDGISVLKALREAKNEVPVLILTAKSEIDDKVEGLDSGADDYLTKPFSTKELLARLRAMTRKKNSAVGSVLSFNDISLDCASFLLSSAQGSCRLAGKEFQIMEMLLANPNSLISTGRFIEKIWGYDSDAEVNVVWVCISNLRKKLLQIGSQVQIKACRGMGYSLEEMAP